MVLDLAVLSHARIGKDFMSQKLQEVMPKKDELFSSRTHFENLSSMVQLSRQDNYSNPSKAKQLTIYVFGFN